MMIRTQVQLTREQIGALKRVSAETGRSIAEVTRQSVDRYLNQRSGPNREEQVKRAIRAAGMFRDTVTDVSVNHDHYLAEAFHADLKGRN